MRYEISPLSLSLVQRFHPLRFLIRDLPSTSHLLPSSPSVILKLTEMSPARVWEGVLV